MAKEQIINENKRSPSPKKDITTENEKKVSKEIFGNNGKSNTIESLHSALGSNLDSRNSSRKVALSIQEKLIT